MKSTKWIKIFFGLTLLVFLIIAIFNYLIDPYGIYRDSDIFKFPKVLQSKKNAQIKIIKTKMIKPVSIVLGSSRAEFGYDPNHDFFLKPAYNLANSGSSMYQNKLNYKLALGEGNLKRVLLVADYRMFNSRNQKTIHDLESYYNINRYSYLFSISLIKDSIKTVLASIDDVIDLYYSNGQIDHYDHYRYIQNEGGYYQAMLNHENNYYKDYPTNYIYSDTGNKSFPDFEYIIESCYRNNIELYIIFGPSNVRQWEVLDYFLGYENLLKWKKDIVSTVDFFAHKYKENPFKVFDFSVYHNFTTEIFSPNKEMKYFWDSSHYKNELGLIVLDRLIDKSPFKDFGVELNILNIDNHLENLKKDRLKFLDSLNKQDMNIKE